MRARRGMGSDSALTSPTFLQALSPAERKSLLEQLNGSASWGADVAVARGAKARPVDAADKQPKARHASGKADHPNLADVPGLVAELFQHKAALRSVPAEIDTLIRDNRALSAEVVQLRKLAASERENASVLGNRLSHLQASLNAKLDQLATPEVLAATQPPAEFPVPAPHAEPKVLGSAVTEINKLRKQLIHTQGLLVKANKHCDHYRQRLSETQSQRKADKAGYQREMAGMQSRLLGAMRRLVYVADKVAVTEATVSERDAYINRLEQQLVTKAVPEKRVPCKAHKDAVNTGRRRPNRRCKSGGPVARSPSPSPVARADFSQQAASSPPSNLRPIASVPIVAPAGILRQPVLERKALLKAATYRQKHDVKSQARRESTSGSRLNSGCASHCKYEGTENLHGARLDAHSLVAATAVGLSVTAEDQQCGFAGHHSPAPGSSIDDLAWDDYRGALDAMQRRIDAMGPMFDAYDAPTLHMDESHLGVEIDADLSMHDYGVLFDPSRDS